MQAILAPHDELQAAGGSAAERRGRAGLGFHLRLRYRPLLGGSYTFRLRRGCWSRRFGSELGENHPQRSYPGRQWIPGAVDDAGKLLGESFGFGEIKAHARGLSRSEVRRGYCRPLYGNACPGLRVVFPPTPLGMP
jgi:hypothetical protein